MFIYGAIWYYVQTGVRCRISIQERGGLAWRMFYWGRCVCLKRPFPIAFLDGAYTFVESRIMKRMWGYAVSVSAGFCLCVYVCGCAPAVRVAPFEPSAAAVQKGLVFYLPKNVLEVAIAYTEYEKKIWPADSRGSAVKKDKKGRAVEPVVTQYAAVVDPVAVQLRTLPDRGLGFVLDPDSLKGALYDSKLNFETFSDGRLKALNCTAADTAADAAVNAGKAAFQLAKVAAVAGRTVAELKKLRKIEVVRLIDPADLTFIKKGDRYVAVYSDRAAIQALLPQATAPDDVNITLSADTDLGALSRIRAAALTIDGEPASELRGVPYRVARPVEVTVTADNYEQQAGRVLYQDTLSFVQAGGIAVVPVQGSMFSTAASSVEFFDKEGTLKKYTASATSPAEAASKAAATVIADAAKQLEDLHTLELELRLARLKKQRDILDAQKDIQALDPESLTSRTERLKQLRALIEAELALEKSLDKAAED